SREYRKAQARRDRRRQYRLHDADRCGHGDPGRPHRRARRLGDRRPRTRGARREAGIQRSGSARCAGEVIVAKPQRSGGDHGEESEESEVEDEKAEVGEKSRAGPEKTAARGEEERREKGDADGKGRCDAGGAEARPRPKPGAVLHPAARVAADGRHVRGRQRRFGRRDLLLISPATKHGPNDGTGRLLLPPGGGADPARRPHRARPTAALTPATPRRRPP